MMVPHIAALMRAAGPLPHLRPDLANRRVQQILKMYGGDVEYIQDTRTQAASVAAATLFAAQQAGQ